jgi:hypothetical protein
MAKRGSSIAAAMIAAAPSKRNAEGWLKVECQGSNLLPFDAVRFHPAEDYGFRTNARFKTRSKTFVNIDIKLRGSECCIQSSYGMSTPLTAQNGPYTPWLKSLPIDTTDDKTIRALEVFKANLEAAAHQWMTAAIKRGEIRTMQARTIDPKALGITF